MYGLIYFRLHPQRPRIDAYLRPEAFLGDLGVDENLMSDQFWHTLREAPFVFFGEGGKFGVQGDSGSFRASGCVIWGGKGFKLQGLKLAGFVAGVWALVRVSVGCR